MPTDKPATTPKPKAEAKPSILEEFLSGMEADIGEELEKEKEKRRRVRESLARAEALLGLDEGGLGRTKGILNRNTRQGLSDSEEYE